MKFTIAVPVLVLMIYTGLRISLYYKSRQELLEQTVFFLNSLKLDFKYSSSSLSEIIEKYSNEINLSKLGYIKECNSALKDNVDFPVAWGKSLEDFKKYKAEEKGKLLSLGEALGTSSTETQLSLIDYYKGIFENYYFLSKRDREKYSNTAILSFTFVGIGIFIILL